MGRPKKKSVNTEALKEAIGRLEEMAKPSENQQAEAASVIEFYSGIQRTLPEDITPQDDKSRGVVLIAIGHPYYSHMAYNLAVSIKFHCPTLPIALLKQGDSLSQITPDDLTLFDKVIEIPDTMTVGRFGYDPYKAKLHLDQISPFYETLYMDVDMLLSPTKPFMSIFDELAAKDIMFANRGELVIEPGKGLRSQWVDLEEIKSVYGMDKVYDLSSEIIWFRKGAKTTAFFNRARTVYDEYKFKVNNFGLGKPDEVFFMVALHLENIKLYPVPFQPTYWQPYHFMKIHGRAFIQAHYALSVGGAFIQRHIKQIYDSFGRHYFNRMGVRKPFYQLIPKSRVLKERSKI